MKRLALVLVLVLTGVIACESSSGGGGTDVIVFPDATEGTVDTTYDVPKTDQPKTDTPVTDTPVTDNPVTDTPVTDNQVTDLPVTDNQVTDPTPTDVGVEVTDLPGEEQVEKCKPCPYFFDCIQDCPQGAAGQACQQACLGELCPEDQQEFQAFYNCVYTNGCLQKTTNEEWAACLEQFCLDPYFKCFSGDKYQTCLDLNNCLDSCPDDDPNTPEVKENQVCWQDCFVNATYQANVDFQAMYDCLYVACPICKTAKQGTPEMDQCNKCANQAFGVNGQCKNQYQKCAPHGTKTCSEVWTCLLSCQDKACAQGCYASGTFTAQDLAMTWVDCALTKCPDGQLSCIDATKTADCMTEWDACANDKATQ